MDEGFATPPIASRDPVGRAWMRAWMRYFEEVPTVAIRAPSFDRLFYRAIRDGRDNDQYHSMTAATLDFKMNDRVLLYASFKRGSKSGGWQALLPLRDFGSVAYDLEHVTSWEMGIKSDLFDIRLRINVAGFIRPSRISRCCVPRRHWC